MRQAGTRPQQLSWLRSRIKWIIDTSHRLTGLSWLRLLDWWVGFSIPFEAWLEKLLNLLWEPKQSAVGRRSPDKKSISSLDDGQSLGAWNDILSSCGFQWVPQQPRSYWLLSDHPPQFHQVTPNHNCPLCHAPPTVPIGAHQSLSIAFNRFQSIQNEALIDLRNDSGLAGIFLFLRRFYSVENESAPSPRHRREPFVVDGHLGTQLGKKKKKKKKEEWRKNEDFFLFLGNFFFFCINDVLALVSPHKEEGGGRRGGKEEGGQVALLVRPQPYSEDLWNEINVRVALVNRSPVDYRSKKKIILMGRQELFVFVCLVFFLEAG